MNLEKKLTGRPVKASVPCRVDFGGTLDISTLYLPMNRLKPSSVNIALDMRTHVTLSPYKTGRVKISSKGFETAEFERGRAPFCHPMGLMFSVAQYFDVHGVHIHIESTSPPRSALGGSSSAAVAIIAALSTAMEKPVEPASAAWLAHYLEASVAGVPCGVQDQLAAAFGGVNQWTWKMGQTAPEFDREILIGTGDAADEAPDKAISDFNSHILVAYCGIPHESKDINSRWVKSFVDGGSRDAFKTVVELTHGFAAAVRDRNFGEAVRLMNEETRVRLGLTPDVLDETGKDLFRAAEETDCGARFTGAGGGGCLWAIGTKTDIEKLRPIWHNILNLIEDAKILDTKVENKGIITD